jgi:DNA-binding CsgD family transcriptional regulator
MAEHGEPLSQREQEVLELVATGATNRQIARDLVVSVNTVKVHLRNIFTKLGVESRTEATLIAIREGWVDVPLETEVTETTTTPVTTPSAPESPLSEAPVKTLPPLPWPKRLALVAALLLVTLVTTATWPRSQQALAPQDPGTNRPADGNGDSNLADDDTKWRALAPMNTARSHFALVATNNQLFAIGGETNGGVTGAMERYDIGADRWTLLSASKPTRVSNIGAAAIGSWIYVPGGRTAEGQATALVEAYHLQDETWSQVAPLPRALSAYALAVYGKQLYLFGGRDNRGYVNTTYIYDPQNDTWRSGAEMPTPRAYAAAATLGPGIFVIGGYDGRREHTTCEIYSPQEDAWKTCKLLIQPRSGLGLASVANRLFAVGGGWSNYFGFNEEYNPNNADWIPFDTPVRRQWHSLAIASTPNKFYVAGGWNGDYLSGVWEYVVLEFEIYVPVTGLGQ